MGKRATDDASETRILPVFPLPDTVFFPVTTLPLHVFERRYRTMVHDVVAGDGLFVVALASADAFADIGTVGFVRDLETLPDGRMNLRLEGLERVSIAEVSRETPYRQVRVVTRPERMGSDDAAVIAAARLDLLASYGIMRRMVRRDEELVLHADLPFEAVVNAACEGLPIDAAARQSLLAEDDLLRRQRRAMEHLAAVIETLSWLRAARVRGSAMIN
jgi:Lon protease-like protein